MENNAVPPALAPFSAADQLGLLRLKLAAEVILAEGDAVPDSLAVELTTFLERVEAALLGKR